MRYIDRNRFREAVEGFGWEAVKQAQLVAMNTMNIDQKKVYIRNHPEWNQLQPIMRELSHHKCWYSEAPVGNNDFEVDHFRPKSKSRQKNDYTDAKSKSTVYKTNGYWWLAYEWINFRLSGIHSNKLRRDRIGECDDVKGKGDCFPLDLVIGRVANDEENTACEVPVLLDPLNPVDVGLLTFDKGIPVPATNDPEEIDRVLQSIFYYHLDLDQLNRDRKIVWNDCVDHIEDAKEAIDNSVTREAKKGQMDKCFKELRKMADSERKAYTSTAKACIMVYSELTGYDWLKLLVRTL